jgi:hypothetical protein
LKTISLIESNYGNLGCSKNLFGVDVDLVKRAQNANRNDEISAIQSLLKSDGSKESLNINIIFLNGSSTQILYAFHF